jgi:hypothetical protein
MKALVASQIELHYPDTDYRFFLASEQNERQWIPRWGRTRVTHSPSARSCGYAPTPQSSASDCSTSLKLHDLQLED